MRNVMLLAALVCEIGCGHAPSGPATPPGTVGTSYPADQRVSPRGRVRPTLTATTDSEEVEYHNPNTGTTSDHDLDVDRDADGNVERINFPDGGWREVGGEMTDNLDGSETYTDERGYEYTVKKSSDQTDPKDSDPESDHNSDSN